MEITLIVCLFLFTIAVFILSFVQGEKISLRFLSAMLLIATSVVLFGSVLYLGPGDNNIITHTVEIGDPGTYARQQICYMLGFMGLYQIMYGLFMILQVSKQGIENPQSVKTRRYV